MSSGDASASILYVTLMPLKPLRMSASMPRMPRTSIAPSTVADTERSWILRPGRQPRRRRSGSSARPTSMYSTGVAALSSEAKISGWSASKVNWCVVLLGAQPVEALDGGTAVRAVDPLDGRAPCELRRFRCFAQRRLRAEERIDVDAVVDGLIGLWGRHGLSSKGVQGAKSLAP